MAIINVPTGGQARAVHVQQLINWLRGLTEYSEPVFFSGITNNSAYALSVANRGTTGLGLRVQNSDRNINLFEVKNDGIIVRANAATGTFFRVRNFADNADLFSVNDTGVTLGGDTIMTLTAAQTATNKTLTAPNLVGAVITTYNEFMHQGSPPSAPVAGRIRVYEASDSLRYIDSTSTVRQFATLDGVETLSNKTLSGVTLSTATLSAPIISNYIEMNWQSASPGGAASKSRLWAKDDNNIYYTLPSGTVVTLQTSLNTPGLSSLSLARPLMLSGG